MNVARIQAQEEYVGKSVLKNCSSVVERRNALHNVPIKVPIVMLREVKEVSWPIVVDGDIDAWKFIQANIMIAHNADDWHQISESSSQLSIHTEEVIPSVRASWHVIVVSNVSTHDEKIWLECCSNFGQVDCRSGVAGISTIDHSNRS